MDGSDMTPPPSKGKKATSYDVARLAGVSQATVSLVLSDKGTGFGITEETARRVREAAASLSYVPNSLVRSIRRGRTDIVGVYARDRAWSHRNSYWIEALSAFHLATAELDRELLLFGDHPNRSTTATVERMLSGIIDGLIVQPGEHNEAIEALCRSQLPLVAVGDPYPGVPSVTIDNAGGVERAVAHLAERGRRSVAFLNFAHCGFGAPRVRQEAFLRAAEAAGILSGFGAVPLEEDVTVLVPRLVRQGVDALVCINDEYAYKALVACADLGIGVPDTMALVGFDGIPVPFAPLRLTTVVSPIDAMCRAAVERLLGVIEGETVPPITTLPVELSVGETT